MSKKAAAIKAKIRKNLSDFSDFRSRLLQVVDSQQKK